MPTDDIQVDLPLPDDLHIIIPADGTIVTAFADDLTIRVEPGDTPVVSNPAPISVAQVIDPITVLQPSSDLSVAIADPSDIRIQVDPPDTPLAFATGLPGPSGPAGLNGTNGVQGPTGPTGPQGNQGPSGPQGTNFQPNQFGPLTDDLISFVEAMGSPFSIVVDPSGGDQRSSLYLPSSLPGNMSGHLILFHDGEWFDYGSFSAMQGPTGPTGPEGPEGPAGPQGATGPSGGNDGWSPQFAVVSDGARRVLQVTGWVGGTGSPPASGQYVGATGLVSSLVSAIDVRGVPGATGPAGTNGASGTRWFEGSGAPSSGLGVNGDFYLNITTGDVYNKAAGVWTVIENIMGPQGPIGFTGSSGPSGPSGPAGPSGGLDGYSPVFAIVTDGARRVLEVVNWVGGTGPKPYHFPDDPVTPGATDYSNSGGTGDRTSLILCYTNKTDSSLGSGTIETLVDGSTSTGGFHSMQFPGGDSGWEIWFDFRPTGHKQCIDEFKWYQSTSNTHGTWTFQAWDGLTWTDLQTGITLGGSTTQTVAFSNTNAYIMYRLVQTGGVTNGSPWCEEIEFKISQGDALSAAATDYSNAGGSGNRTSSITVMTDITFTSGSASALVDGTNNAGTNEFQSGESDKHLIFDFGSGNLRVIDEFKWYQGNNSNHGLWVLQGSLDDITWSDIGTPFTLAGPPGGGSVTYSNPAYNKGAWRYYRLAQLHGTTSGPDNYEIEFKISSSSAGTRWFVGATTLVTNISDAVDIRGPAGATGPSGPSGPSGPAGPTGDAFAVKETVNASGGVITTSLLSQDALMLSLQSVTSTARWVVALEFSTDGTNFDGPHVVVFGPPGLIGGGGFAPGQTLSLVIIIPAGLTAGIGVVIPGGGTYAANISFAYGSQIKKVRVSPYFGSMTGSMVVLTPGGV
jgi:hypothetical protein